MDGNGSVELKVGMKLWWVCNTNARSQHEVSVVKVGRVWATLNNGNRIDLHLWRADGKGYSSPGRCHVSEAAYKAELELSAAWQRFRNECYCQGMPSGITAETIRQVRSILGMKAE